MSDVCHFARCSQSLFNRSLGNSFEQDQNLGAEIINFGGEDPVEKIKMEIGGRGVTCIDAV